MIMSTLSIGRHETTAGGALASLAAGAGRLWLAYITWRIDQFAVAELRSMSDHALNDLGLARSDIGRAVKAGRSPDPGPGPSVGHPGPTAP